MPVLGRTSVGQRLATLSARGPGFDLIRLMAALTVLFHHAWWGVDDVLYRYSKGFMQFGLLAVIVFFSISGFLVAPGLVRSGDVVRFAVNRSLRIFPALVLVVVASMFVLGPLLTKYPLTRYFTSPELYLYLKNITTQMAHCLPGVEWRGEEVRVNGALWTLNIEVCSYAALATLSVIGFLRRRVLTLNAFGVAYLVYVTLALVPSLNAACPLRLVNFVGLFVYFMAGASLYLYADRIPFSGILATSAVVLALIGLAAGIGAVVLPLCAPYLVVYLGLSNLTGRIPLRHDLSYGVYLIHSPVILAIRTTFDLDSGWLLAMFAAPVTLFLGYASWRVVEEPALNQKASVSNWVSMRLAHFDGRRARNPGAARRAEQPNIDKVEADPVQGREGALASGLRSKVAAR